jgi:serine/threonine protein kinase
VKSGREVAIKEMDSELISEQEIGHEITILKQLKHPNIVEYEDAFQVPLPPPRTTATSTSSLSTAEAETCVTCSTAATRRRVLSASERSSTCSGRFVRVFGTCAGSISSTGT